MLFKDLFHRVTVLIQCSSGRLVYTQFIHFFQIDNNYFSVEVRYSNIARMISRHKLHKYRLFILISALVLS